MGKKDGREGAVAGGGGAETTKEGKNLLGKPTFKKLENGRLKCKETGHELPASAKESYAQTKHCRLGLIDAALKRCKPPLNMFDQDPLERSKLICKLTGVTINKTEEHIWKHINGKKFLFMLEQKEAETETQKEAGTEAMEVDEKVEQAPEKESKQKDSSKKKKKKKKKEKEEEEKEISGNGLLEVTNSPGKESNAEEADFWMPPAGGRWDSDDGGDRWNSGSESEMETEDVVGAATTRDAADTGTDAGAAKERKVDGVRLSKRARKRLSKENGPSSVASKKKKTKST